MRVLSWLICPPVARLVTKIIYHTHLAHVNHSVIIAKKTKTSIDFGDCMWFNHNKKHCKNVFKKR